MVRNTTLSKEWKTLIQAVGSINEVCKSLGVSQTTFYRASRGMIPFPDDKGSALEILCQIYSVTNPLERMPKARVKDLVPLRLLGEALTKGMPTASRTLERLREMYPQAQLLELAESDGTPESILRAVTKLLEE